MKNILLKLLIPVAIVCIIFFLPTIKIEDVEPLISLAALLFTILAGFFIAATTTNYLNFQSALAQEGAVLIQLYNLGKLISPSSADKIRDSIDEYVIATLDFPIGEYIDGTNEEFNKLIGIIDSIEPDDDKKRRTESLGILHSAKSSLYNFRQQVALCSLKVINTIHWIILIFLEIAIITLLIPLRSDNLLAMIIICVLAIASHLVLVLLGEIDSNYFLERQLGFKDTHKVFIALGLLPYYPPKAFSLSYGVEKPKGIYRLGVYRNFPRSLEKEIKIIDEK